MSLLNKPTSAYDLAAKLLVLTGVLHIVAFLVTGLTFLTIAIFGVIYALLGLGLLRGWRKLACLALIVTLIGLIAAYANLPAGGLLFWFLALFILIDLVIAAALFLDIWKRR